MTDTILEPREMLALPFSEALAAARQAGLLPARTTDQAYRAEPGQTEPAVSALVTSLTPKLPVTAKGYASATRPDYYEAGPNARVTMYTKAGEFDGVVWHTFTGMIPGKPLVLWIKLRVFSGSSLVIGGSGNPAQISVSASSSGSQPISVPVSLSANADGRVLTYLVPAQDGMGGDWYSSSLYTL